jgi:nitroreductase
MDFRDVVTSRRMTRHFRPEPVGHEVLLDLVDLASRSPSAGKTQGWSLLVLEKDDATAFWELSLPHDKRASFAWPTLLTAPVIALSFADPDAYVERYAEPDKAHTGLGAGIDAWQTPYWTVDGSFATMTFLLAAHDVGLGALFFAVFNAADRIRAEFGVPDHLQLLGAIALGHPSVPENDSELRTGRSARRPRRAPDDVVHFGRWSAS